MEHPKVDISLKVHQLTEALCDLKEEDVKLQNPFYLNHWLRSHKLDVHKTEQAIRASVKWRQDNNITDALIYEDLDPEIENRFPMFFDLMTKEGAPFVYGHFGAMNFVDLLKRFGKDRLTRHFAQILIKMEQVVLDWDNQWKGSLEDLPADRTRGFFGVFDADGFSFRQSASIQVIQLFLEWAKLWLNNFPSVVRTSRMLNTSRLVDLPFRLVKSLAAAKDCDLTILGSGESELKDHVFSKIEPRIFEELKGRSKALKAKLKNDS